MSLFSFLGFNIQTAGVILFVIILGALSVTAGYFIGKRDPSSGKSIIWDATSYKMLKEKLIEYDGSLKTDPGLPSIINNFIKQNPNLKISDLEKYSTKQSIDKIINDVRNRSLTDPGPPSSCTQGCDYKTCDNLDSCGNKCGCKDPNQCNKGECNDLSKWTPELQLRLQDIFSPIMSRITEISFSRNDIECFVRTTVDKFKTPSDMNKIPESERNKTLLEIMAKCIPSILDTKSFKEITAYLLNK